MIQELEWSDRGRARERVVEKRVDKEKVVVEGTRSGKRRRREK